MGLARTKVTLADPQRSDLSPLEVDALVDTGAIPRRIPAHAVKSPQIPASIALGVPPPRD